MRSPDSRRNHCAWKTWRRCGATGRAAIAKAGKPRRLRHRAQYAGRGGSVVDTIDQSGHRRSGRYLCDRASMPRTRRTRVEGNRDPRVDEDGAGGNARRPPGYGVQQPVGTQHAIPHGFSQRQDSRFGCGGTPRRRGRVAGYGGRARRSSISVRERRTHQHQPRLRFCHHRRTRRATRSRLPEAGGNV